MFAYRHDKAYVFPGVHVEHARPSGVGRRAPPKGPSADNACPSEIVAASFLQVLMILSKFYSRIMFARFAASAIRAVCIYSVSAFCEC